MRYATSTDRSRKDALINTLLSGATRVAYKFVIKPVLFRLSPDAVHARMVKTGRHFSYGSLVTKLLRKALRYDNSRRLAQTIEGIDFPNPVGLSAGLDKNFELVPLMQAVGFGFMEGGSITYKECDGNPRPWFYRLPRSKSLVVHAGLANHGAVTILNRLTHFTTKLPENFPLNISVAKTNSPDAVNSDDAVADYIGTLTMVKSAGIGDMYTLNISCPNTYGGEPFTTPAKLELLLKATDNLHLERPLFIKMPIDLSWDKFYRLLKVINTHAVAGVTIGNLTKRRSEVREPLPSGVKGHLSGLPTKELSTYLIDQTYRHFSERFTIIGVGGIFSSEDAYEKIRHGASLVELVTGIIFEGPQLIGQINRDLVKLLEQDGFKNISEAIGSATDKT